GRTRSSRTRPGTARRCTRRRRGRPSGPRSAWPRGRGTPRAAPSNSPWTASRGCAATWTRPPTCAARPGSGWAGTARRSPPNCSDVYHGAGERPGDPGHGLDVPGDQPSEFVDVVCLGPHDDVVGPGDVFGLRDAADLSDERGHVGGLADFCLDEDVSLHHEVLPGDCGTGAPARSRYRRGPDHVTRVPPWCGGVRRWAIAPDEPPTLASLGEFGLIAAVSAGLPPNAKTLVGIGDDAAVLATPDGRVVATTDFLLEGRHFRRDWSSAADVGHKAAARSLADCAAMGAEPSALLVALAAPPDLPVSWARELTAGLAAECARAGASVIGGDTARAGSVLLAVTGLGDLGGRKPVLRSGARPGDVVAVAGPLGHAAAGLALLMAGMNSEPLVREHLRPAPPYDAGPEAAVLGATALIDVSDGLLADLGHVADASGVQIRLVSDGLRPERELLAAARKISER